MKKILCIITCILMTAALCGGCAENEPKVVERHALFDLLGQPLEVILKELNIEESQLISTEPENAPTAAYEMPLRMEYAGLSFDTRMGFNTLDLLNSIYYTRTYEGTSVECAKDILKIVNALHEEYGEPKQKSGTSYGGVLNIEDEQIDELYEEIINGRYKGDYYMWLAKDRFGDPLKAYVESLGDGYYQFFIRYGWDWNSETNTTTITLSYSVGPWGPSSSDQ